MISNLKWFPYLVVMNEIYSPRQFGDKEGPTLLSGPNRRASMINASVETD